MFLAECGVIGNSDSTRMEAALLAIGEFTLAHSVLKAKTPDSWCPFPEFSLDHWNTVRSSVADNAYTLGSERRVLFHLTSRINHSCSPNAFRKHYKNQIQVFATRDISPGSEIFLQYSVKAGHEDKSHFECDCKRSLPDRKLIQKESSHIWNFIYITLYIKDNQMGKIIKGLTVSLNSYRHNDNRKYLSH